MSLTIASVSASDRAKAILIVGMHRSGTSALARVVNLMGAFIGNQAELVPPHPSINPTGYWERVDIVVEQDRFLQRNGFGWGTLANFDLDRIAEDRKHSLASSLRNIVRGMGQGDAPLVIKDPRTCLLLPVWRDVVAAPVYVVVVRDPRKIAASLMASFPASFTTDFLLALWQKYMQSALAALRSERVLFVAYERLLVDATAEHDRLLHGLQALGAKGLSALEPGRLRATFDGRLDRSEPSPHARLSAEQRQICDWLAVQCESAGPVTVADFPAVAPPDAVLAELEMVRHACMQNGWQMALQKGQASG